MPRATRLVIRNYRGIEAREIDIPPGGFVAVGRNGAGKTSILGAIRAALAAQDIGPDAIRAGADKAEILVDLDDVHVRRAITKNGSTLTVKRGDFKASAPQGFLTDLLGTSPLDPLALFLAKPAARKQMILSALPLEVSAADLSAWAPVPEGFDASGHALDVVARLRKHHYDARTDANAVARARRAEADRLAKEATEARAAAGGEPDALPDLAAAKGEALEATAVLGAVLAEARAAEGALERTAKTRQRIEALRASATESRTRAGAVDVTDDTLRKANERSTRAREHADELRRMLGEAERECAEAREQLALLDQRRAAARTARELAEKNERTAADLESALGEAPHVGPEAIEKARARAERAEADVGRATKGWLAREAAERARSAEDTAARAEAQAAALDAIVKRLTDEVPAALLARSGGIEGLALDGDEVLLDGVRLDRLCGNEQMRFAIEIARRLNVRSRILVVDGLERIDPEQQEAFVTWACSGGYQLLATRVDRGDVVIESIEPSVHGEAAE